jgi:UDP-glucose 4-epimerase
LRKYLITGGCGFIGSHLADALLAEGGNQVTILDNLSSGSRANAPAVARLIVGDICDAKLVGELVGVHDCIIHLAAIASVQACTEQWLHTHQTNVTGSITLLEAAVRAQRQPKFIYASSAAIYGDNPALPLRETAIAAPQNNYGLDKYALELYAAQAFAAYGLNSVGLRFFNVYGPRQNPNSPYSGVISKFAQAAKDNAPITIFGDGQQTRDFINVADIVQLIIAAANSAITGAKIANGCTGNATSLQQLAQHIREVSGAQLPVAYAPARQGDIVHSVGDAMQAARQFNFRAKVAIRDGLTDLLAQL